MTKFASSALLIATLALAPFAALSAPGGNGNGNAGGGTNPGGKDQGFASATWSETTTVTTVTAAQFMGMSNKTPPNAKAAASQGVRTETTTTTTVTTVYYETDGPKGQIDQGNLACDNCTTVESGRSVTQTSETSVDGPGKRKR